MRALKFITGHVIYNLAYTYKFQLKTTKVLEKYQNYHLKIILLNITLLVDWSGLCRTITQIQVFKDNWVSNITTVGTPL